MNEILSVDEAKQIAKAALGISPFSREHDPNDFEYDVEILRVERYDKRLLMGLTITFRLISKSWSDGKIEATDYQLYTGYFNQASQTNPSILGLWQTVNAEKQLVSQVEVLYNVTTIGQLLRKFKIWL